jgi:predicted ATPase with chaperone activity
LIFLRKQVKECREEVKNKPKESKTSTNSKEIMIDILMKSIGKSSSFWIID